MDIILGSWRIFYGVPSCIRTNYTDQNRHKSTKYSLMDLVHAPRFINKKKK